MNKIEEIKIWLEIASEDYNTALFLRNMKPIPLEIICFHCQQSAEKDLKAYLIKNDIIVQKTHNLELILKKCIEIDFSFKDIYKSCLRLTDYAVELRYPYRLEITNEIMELAIEDATLIKEFVNEKIFNKSCKDLLLVNLDKD